MGNYGLKVSLPGKDISSTIPEDFVFSSSNPGNIQIVSRALGTVSVNGNSSSDVTVSHNLGYIPMIMLFTELTPGSGNWHMGIPLTNAGETYVQSDPTYTYVSTADFKFRVTNSTGSTKAVKYYYYVFSDVAN